VIALASDEDVVETNVAKALSIDVPTKTKMPLPAISAPA